MDFWLQAILIILFLNGIAAILIGTYLPSKDETVDLVHEDIREEEEAL